MHQDGVTIRRGFCNYIRTYCATGSTTVVDQHGLTHRFAHALGQDTRNDIGGSACGERHDHFDGLGWIGLCKGQTWHSGHAQRTDQNSQ